MRGRAGDIVSTVLTSSRVNGPTTRATPEASAEAIAGSTPSSPWPMTRTRELLPARAAAARNPDLTASAARPYVGDSSGRINAMTSLCAGGLLATGATGRISGGAGAGATVTVGAGGGGVTAGAGNALGVDAVAAGG